ncbi:E3 ubiquitin-protein ligase ATL31-like [Musa acuminata AAA Group]|uniref:E3 ubiquitin-protein ligase ATL31 n=1 Tax=Musa acuminata AAA Group TaxID=214697 RepID=UPI0031DF45C9
MATTLRRRSIAALSNGRGVMAVLFMLALLPLTPRCAAQSSAPSSHDSGPTNPTTLSPSTATIIAVLISAFFFLAFFFVYIRQCANDDDPSNQHVGYEAVARSGRRRGAVGMSPEVLEMFPMMSYSDAKALKVGRGTLECAVCLSEFEDDETLRLLPGCCHVFHPECIGAWLASHVTCPVCRSDLSTVSLEQPPASSAAAPAPDHVVVVDQSPTEEETIELTRIGSERREARSRRGRRSTKLPRSHSTGHSVAQPQEGEDVDRYTLRLPEHIRREIFAARKFHRSTSCVAFPVAGEGSSRPGYRGGAAAGGEGSSRGGRTVRAGVSDRWPSFLIRTLSFTIPAWKRGDNEGSVKKGEAEGSSRGRFGGVRTPFDCLGGGGRGDAPGDERGPTQ